MSGLDVVMEIRRWNVSAVVSVVVCAALVFVGFVRFLSYSQGMAGELVRGSVFAFLDYDPNSVFSARFFKVLATPSIVAMVYFFFRWRNAGIPFYPTSAVLDRAERLNFASPVLRAVLTSVTTLGWFVMEWLKFHVAGFYPDSPLEHAWINAAVLVVSGALTFQGMKYLSFAPLSHSPDSG